MEFVNRLRSQYIRISSVVDGEGEINIEGPIGNEGGRLLEGYSLRQFREDIKGMNSRIVINIASLGGNLFEALGIYDAIRSTEAEVETRIIGTSASAATLISLAGDKRLISPNSRYLIHKPLVMSQGNSDEMKKIVSELERLDTQVIDIYSERTGMSREDVEALLKEERFLSAEEAISMGFIHSYIPEKDSNKNANMKKSENVRDPRIDAILNSIEEDLKFKLKAQEEEEKPEKEEMQEDPQKEEEEEMQEKEEEKVEEMQEDPEKEEEEEEENPLEAKIKALEKKLEEKEEELRKLQLEIKEKEVENSISKLQTIENTVDEYISKGIITAESKEEWIDIGSNMSMEMLETLLSAIRIPEATALKDVIEPKNAGLTRKSVIDMFKKGEISFDEYGKLLTRIKK